MAVLFFAIGVLYQQNLFATGFIKHMGWPIQHIGFDGQLTDGQTNWQPLGRGYRAYNPLLHRLMSEDSLSPFGKGGINGYVFSSNNPIMNFDPSGHFPILPILSSLVPTTLGGVIGWGVTTMLAGLSSGTLAFVAVGSAMASVGGEYLTQGVDTGQWGHPQVGSLLSAAVLGASMSALGSFAASGLRAKVYDTNEAVLLKLYPEIYNDYPELKKLRLLGMGGTGAAFVDGAEGRVTKVTFPSKREVSYSARFEPERVARLWNEIYQHFDDQYANAFVTDSGLLNTPLIKGRSAKAWDYLNMRATCRAIRASGRIFADIKPENFVIHEGRAYPIDVDMSPSTVDLVDQSIASQGLYARRKTRWMTRISSMFFS